MSAEENQQPLTHRFSTVGELREAHMPFVRDGGLFIPTDNQFHLGDTVTVSITLPDDQTFVFSGEVIWITPKSIHSSQHHPGIGIQCNDDEGEAFQKAMQQSLSGLKDEGGNTETM